ncbi:MAG: sugar isomerase [Planctomycetes bacterium]|nr:sugar isomerase [Planctomycetota bacterium]
MNLKSPKYSRYSLVREMLQTQAVVAKFNPACVKAFVGPSRAAGRLMLTGEGSSRIFPAKHAIELAMRRAAKLQVFTEGGRQAAEYDLKNFAVYGASNSGKTREVLDLFGSLRKAGHRKLFGLTAIGGSPLTDVASRSHVLSCGKEQAVAATKSVVEQALFYHALLSAAAGKAIRSGDLKKLAAAIGKALTASISPAIVKAAAKATRIYWAGRNNGVAEELTLKTNEIARKPSGYLEGTYAVHGVEEVMNKTDLVIVIDPFRQELGKFEECLKKGVGLTLIAVAGRKAGPLPTIIVPKVAPEFAPYVQLAAGWNLLVEIGLANGINLDKAQRARKIGNEAKIGKR